LDGGNTGLPIRTLPTKLDRQTSSTHTLDTRLGLRTVPHWFGELPHEDLPVNYWSSPLREVKQLHWRQGSQWLLRIR